MLKGIREAAAAVNGPTATYVVDNRQSNHQWGPFMWAAGSYAEPMQSDEQPESWQAVVPDPSTDREAQSPKARETCAGADSLTVLRFRGPLSRTQAALPTTSAE